MENQSEEGAVVEDVGEKLAFIVTPIGSDDSDIRRATDGLFDSVLKPVLDEAGYKGISSHHEDDPGSISGKVVSHLVNDDLVIVNLTHLNANVMYELGIRHATGKPVILIATKGTGLPFDTQDQRTIFYTNDMMGVMELREKLRRLISDEDKLKNNDGNPVFMAANENIINRAIEEKLNSQGLSANEKGLAEMMLERMDNFESKIVGMMAHNKPNHSSENSKKLLLSKMSDSVCGLEFVYIPSGGMVFGIKDEADYKELKEKFSEAGVRFTDFGNEDDEFYLVGVSSNIVKRRKKELEQLAFEVSLPF